MESKGMFEKNLRFAYWYVRKHFPMYLEQLQAENDRLRRERDAAVEDLNAIIGDIEEIRRGYGVDNGDADSAFADLCGNYCANKSHRCYVEAEKYRCNNFKWRGPKEE